MLKRRSARTEALISIIQVLVLLQIVNAAGRTVDFFGSKGFGSDKPTYYHLVKGDFDGDGKVDVVTSSINDIFIHYGDGRGGFTIEPVTIPRVGGSHRLPVAGDFNGDGVSDVVFTNTSRLISVYLGNRNRTFSVAIVSGNISSAPDYLEALDFDSDGKVDVLGYRSAPEGSAVLFCKGDGTGHFSIGGQLPVTDDAAPTFADFDNDNLKDVLYQSDDRLWISKNLGNGAFGTPILLIPDTFGYVVSAAGDLNLDGKQDFVLVETYPIDPYAYVFLGNGSLGFTEAQEITLSSNEKLFYQATGDLDNDSLPELVLASSNKTVILKAIGGGMYGAQVSYLDGGNGTIVEDFDNDGWRDIAGSSASDTGFGYGEIAVLRNLGNGNFRSAPYIRTNRGLNDIAVTDFNADQRKDLVVVCRGSGGGGGSIYVLIQTATAGFATGPAGPKDMSSLIPSLAVDYYSVVAGDFNQDGKQDFVAAGVGANGGVANASLLRGNGAGGFLDSIEFTISSGTIYDVAMADFNADGKNDLVSASSSGTLISFGAVGPSFLPAQTISVSPTDHVVLRDFNNDGKMDVAATSGSPRTIRVFLGNGSGTFSNPSNPIVGVGLNAIAAADVNGDNNVDLIAAAWNSVSVLLGNGDGTFQAESRYLSRTKRTNELTVADINGDSFPDIVVGTGLHSVSVFENNGSGGFGAESVWAGGGEMTSIAAADLDNDGKTDILAGISSSSNGYVKLLFNNSFDSPKSVGAPFDFDGDGSTDLAVFRPSNGQWWLDRSTDGVIAHTFGNATDVIAPADFTGDGKTDVALFRPASGEWFVLRSEDSTYYSFPFGIGSDVPVPADYDGDGIADAAVFRPSNGAWYVLNSAGGTTIRNFGNGADRPVPSDYDGDGKVDIAIYRPSNGQWWIERSNLGLIVHTFGIETDKAVPGDYTGDGISDIAIWRPFTGEWFVLRSQDFTYYSFPFGVAGDLPAIGDFDGDGRFDAAVFRESSGRWYVQRTTSGLLVHAFGSSGDIPVPGAGTR